MQCRWKPSLGLLVYLLGPSQKSAWLVHDFMLKLVDVKPLRWFLPLGTSFGWNMDGEFGYKQPMVCPAVCTTHCLWSPLHISILPSGDDKVCQVPVSGAWLHPTRPMEQAEYSVR